MTKQQQEHDAPNHHAHHGGFHGIGGFAAALSMLVGREDNARLAERLGTVGPEDVVLDIGCGPGVAVRRAARSGATVTGVDPASVMLTVARRLTRGGDVRYVEGAAEALPVEDDSVTVVWAIATVHHWAEIEAGLREARRVLRSGGRLVAIERRTHSGARGHASHGWTDAQAAAFADRCREQGFVDPHVD